MSQSPDAPRPQISLLQMGRFVRRNWLILALCTFVAGALATGFASILTPKYRSEVVFAPTNGSGGMGDLGGQLGGLAALAGVNLGGTGKRSEEFLEYLRSQGFTRQFIERHNLLPVLFARRWDAAAGRWKTADPPTLADGERIFSKTIRQISEDRRTGIVKLAIVWRDRVAAAQWANQLIAEADAALRQRAIDEYGRSIDYLSSEAARTSVVELHAAIAKTLEVELRDTMFARTRDAYAFKVLDPAIPREPKDIDSPQKLLFAALGSLAGLLVGVIIAASR